MSEHVFSTPDGTIFPYYERDAGEDNALQTIWEIRIFTKDNTGLGFEVMYPLAFVTENKDNPERDFALVEYALKNDTDKVLVEGRKGYKINCAQEPYLSICRSF